MRRKNRQKTAPGHVFFTKKSIFDRNTGKNREKKCLRGPPSVFVDDLRLGTCVWASWCLGKLCVGFRGILQSESGSWKSRNLRTSFGGTIIVVVLKVWEIHTAIDDFLLRNKDPRKFSTACALSRCRITLTPPRARPLVVFLAYILERRDIHV